MAQSEVQPYYDNESYDGVRTIKGIKHPTLIIATSFHIHSKHAIASGLMNKFGGYIYMAFQLINYV